MKLLLELKPHELTALIDFSYLEEVLTIEEAESILKDKSTSRNEREGLLDIGYPGL